VEKNSSIAPDIDSAGYLTKVAAAAKQVNPQEFAMLVESIADVFKRERFVFIIGNGGSGANASHLCEDLGKGTLTDFDTQKRLKAVSLTDNTPYILAWGNDTAFERIFVEQLKSIAGPGDLLIAISGSGNSPSVLRAIEYANTHGIATFGATGFDGGKLRKIAGACLHVPCPDMGIVEAVHGIYFHYLIDVLRERFRGVKADRKSTRLNSSHAQLTN
jgi:D-sedoheptulose 7-phosphate isomerase